MENSKHIEIKKSLVLEKEAQVQSQQLEIKNLFQKKTDLIEANNGIVNKEVDEISHSINRLFDSKAKLEAEVKVLKKDILNLVLYA